MFQHTLKLSLALLLGATVLACDDGGGGEGGTGGTAGAAGGGMGGAAGMVSGGMGGMTGGIGGGGGGGMTGGMGGMTGGMGGMGGMMAVPLEPKFSSIYANILKPTCNAGVGCHTGALSTLDMSTQEIAYTALYNMPVMSMNVFPTMLPSCMGTGAVRVVPGDPAMSVLVAKLEHTHTCGAEMPPAVPMIAADKIAAIRTWIMNGAMND